MNFLKLLKMDLNKLSKKELLLKCEELGLQKYKSINKKELIELINNQEKKSIKNIETIENKESKENNEFIEIVNYNLNDNFKFEEIKNKNDIDIDNEYKEFINSGFEYENNQHYLNLICLKDTNNGPYYDNELDIFIKDIQKLSNRSNLKYKCVLPKNHIGKCSYKFNNLFIKNEITDKLIKSIDLGIYNTPGNDDYVYKNRSSRLYNNVLSSKQEKKIRDKKIKKKCAIPLKDASTPILLAQAYLDWITFIVNVKDISQYIKDNNSVIMNIIQENKNHLISVYSNRKIFNDEGYSICVITSNIIRIEDISEPNRDNRIYIYDNDIQIGHNHPRSENYVSIRGENLIPMSRRGNLIIGEKIFTQNLWIDELKQIIKNY